METIITKNYEELSERAAQIVIELVQNNPCAVFGTCNGQYAARTV